jgi:PTS system galactitol-specific IIC component
MPIKKAFLSVLQLGTGFAGIFIAFDFFISNINPAVKALMIMIHPTFGSKDSLNYE